ncbi:hypothetical protein ONE63_005637 [Megalurothrips usitatus]|uniref:Uncharacterized protein n=1 Tax=Megalurothrips usitatus TaxID=439358 RepID=A0AAV7Y037_9NEOP|nr:hypothetical protein ONE63_005637 [Megalurothrips usitatus]
MQVQQSYQSLHDYQALNKNSYQNLASLQDQSQQQTYYGYQQAAQQQHQAYQDQAYLQQAYQQSQQQQAYQQSQQQPSDQQSQQQQTYQQSQQQQAYQQSQQQPSDRQSQQQQTYQQSQQQQAYQDYQQKVADQQKQSQDYQDYQQKVADRQKQSQDYQQKLEQQKQQQDEQSEEEDDEHQKLQGQAQQKHQETSASTYTPNVLSYVQGLQGSQGQAAAGPQSSGAGPQQSVENAVSIAEAVAAAAAVTQTPERFYEAVAATGVTPNPYRVPARAGVLPHFKQAVSPAVSPAMQAAMTYYKNGYYADPALLQHLNRAPYRRISGPAPRPYARPRPHAHAHPHAHPHAHAHDHPHTHVVPFSRYKSSPTVQHFFHGPYTMESPALAAAPAGAASDSWIEHALSPAVKRDDSLLSGLGSPPGSSTALLNGLLVPIVLLGLSIPALGFAYTYLSRRRALDTDVTSFVQNLRPNEETVDYYFNVLQNAIECFNDPKRQHCE